MAGSVLLRQRLVEAAVTTIESDGIEATSLRSVAAAAGVSRQAPYLCFADKRVMLAAAAAAVLRRERARWCAALGRAGPSPAGRLLALALAHARFARAHPHLHALTWGPYVAKADATDLQQEAIHCFTMLRETVAACLPTGSSIGQQRACSIVVWAAVKGLVDLSAHRQIPTSVETSVEDLIRGAIRALVAGWAKAPAR